MSIYRTEIKKGINLNIIYTDKFKTDYFSVKYFLPVTRQNNAASSLLPKVIMRGTAGYPDMEKISYALDDLYAADIYPRVSSRGETQLMGFGASFLKDRFSVDGTKIRSGVFSMMKELLFCPLLDNGAFLSEYVESEKKQLIDAINARKDNKTKYAVQRCEEIMCENEPYGIPTLGYADDVEKITPKTLCDFYKYTLENAPCEIYYIGSEEKDIIEREIRLLFADAPESQAVSCPCSIVRSAAKLREAAEETDAEQSKLTIGFRCGTALSDGDWHKFAVFAQIFGSSPTSKLFMNVREKLSLCYYCSLSADPLKGIMLVYSGIKTENREKAQKEIFAQLEEIKQGRFSEKELDNAKSAIINSYNSLFDSPSSLEGWYTGRLMAKISSSPEEAIELAKGVSREDVINAANKITADTVYFMKAGKVNE